MKSAFIEIQADNRRRLLRLDQITLVKESIAGLALVYLEGNPGSPIATDATYVEFRQKMVEAHPLPATQVDHIEQKLDSIIVQMNQPIQLNYGLLLDEHVERIGSIREFPDEPGGPFNTKRPFKNLDALMVYIEKLLEEGQPKDWVEAYYRRRVMEFYPYHLQSPEGIRAG